MGLVSESRDCRCRLVPENTDPENLRINWDVVRGGESAEIPSARSPELFSQTGANCLTLYARAIILSMCNNGEYWKPRTSMSRRSVSGRGRLMGYGARYIFGPGKEIIR